MVNKFERIGGRFISPCEITIVTGLEIESLAPPRLKRGMSHHASPQCGSDLVVQAGAASPGRGMWSDIIPLGSNPASFQQYNRLSDGSNSTHNVIKKKVVRGALERNVLGKSWSTSEYHNNDHHESLCGSVTLAELRKKAKQGPI